MFGQARALDDVTPAMPVFQLAVIHSMRQIISYSRVPDYFAVPAT
jgi:hypothetical protein